MNERRKRERKRRDWESLSREKNEHLYEEKEESRHREKERGWDWIHSRSFEENRRCSSLSALTVSICGSKFFEFDTLVYRKRIEIRLFSRLERELDGTGAPRIGKKKKKITRRIKVSKNLKGYERRRINDDAQHYGGLQHGGGREREEVEFRGKRVPFAKPVFSSSYIVLLTRV